MKESRVFLSDSFWPAFQEDLARAKARVVIQSPFLATRRAEQLRTIFRTLRLRNVHVCLFVQEPSNWHKSPEQLTTSDLIKNEEMREIHASLLRDGLHLTLRKQIHEKVAVVDNKLLWEGSLNILSHNRTNERMRRIVSPQEVQEAMEQHNFNACSTCEELLSKYEFENVLSQLRRARTEMNLSQKSLAERCGLRQSSIARIESGEHDTQLSTINKVTKKLDSKVIIVPSWLCPTIANLLDQVCETQSTHRR